MAPDLERASGTRENRLRRGGIPCKILLLLLLIIWPYSPTARRIYFRYHATDQVRQRQIWREPVGHVRIAFDREGPLQEFSF